MFTSQRDIFLTARMPQCSTEQIPEKVQKKKRWWGDLFRRSNKIRRKPSDSSSDEEENSKRRGLFLGRKRHSDRGSKDVTNNFLINPGLRDVPRGRSLDSVKSPERSSKRRIKAKVEASRELLKDSSSDEASSYTSSLHSGGSFPRRSRAARTERHIRRLSRDLEVVQNTVVTTTNKSKWSASVVYQECMEYDRKYRAKARSATPSPAQSPKIKRPAGRATSFDNIKSSPPPPPPRKLPEQRPLSLETPPMRVYNPPVYTAPTQSRTKSRYHPEYVSEPWLATPTNLDKSPTSTTTATTTEEAKKPPTAPPRKQISNEERRRQQNNLEEALNELEAIYKKLASEDGQDNQSEMSEDKRPLEDDMAYRRLNKREPSCQDMREIMSQTGSYLLVSPTLSPPPIIPHSPIMNGDEPDIISDDVVFRTMNHTNNTLKICDPQLPFGIPIGPISPSSPSDYLHVELKPRFDCKPTKLPDIVHDDLAFRNLRKDTKDLKKKKAVRSLSANLTNLIRNNNNFHMQNNNLEGKSYSFQDIPEELRLAYNVRKKSIEDEESEQHYLTELCASENDLLRELEEEARATSVQLDEELRQLSEQQETDEPSVEALYSRSMTDLLKELTKNLDYDFGFNDEQHHQQQQSVLLANCQTCDTQTTRQTTTVDTNSGGAASGHLNVPKSSSNHLNINNNRRLDLAECRRQFFESPHFNRKIEREASLLDKTLTNKNDWEKENLSSIRCRRSPSNPETTYNDLSINGYEHKIVKSPIRTISADSSKSKENIKSFIEKPFTRSNRSPNLESSKSFSEKHSTRMTKIQPSSFSNDREFLNKEINFDQFNRFPNVKSGNSSTSSNNGKTTFYNDFSRSRFVSLNDKMHTNDIRQRLRSPVKMDINEKSSTSTFLDKPHCFVRPTMDYNHGKPFMDTYKNFGQNKTYVPTDLERIRTFNPAQNGGVGGGTKPRTCSEDLGYNRGIKNSTNPESSRSFDTGTKTIFDEHCGGQKNMGVRCSPGHDISSGYCAAEKRSSPHVDLSLELHQEQAQNSINIKTTILPSSSLYMNTSSIEAAQKRKSFAESTDVQIDEQFPKDLDKLRQIRTPIDLEAIEKDSSIVVGHSPPQSSPSRRRLPEIKTIATTTDVLHSEDVINDDDDDIDASTSSSSSAAAVVTSRGNGLANLAPNNTNDVTNWQEEEIKQGSLVWTACCLACSHQLIGLDMITILALILAMISIVLLILL